MYQRIRITIEARHDGRLRVLYDEDSMLFTETPDGILTYDKLSVGEATDVVDVLVGRSVDRVRSYLALHGHQGVD